MPQILVWKCPHTGELFESKTKYQTHLKRLSVERVARRKEDKFKAERAAYFKQMRDNVRTPEELVNFVKDNWEAFCNNAVVNDPRRFEPKRKPHPDLEYLKLTEFRWDPNLSCSHSAPIGKQTNWGGNKKDQPTGYPGWKARIEYQTTDHKTHKYEYSGDMWKGTGVHTGTGGYASNYYYYIELWADDWPAMAEPFLVVEEYRKLNFDNRKVEEIVATVLNTAEKVAAFTAELPALQERYEAARTWKAIKGDQRGLSTIMQEMGLENA